MYFNWNSDPGKYYFRALLIAGVLRRSCPPREGVNRPCAGLLVIRVFDVQRYDGSSSGAGDSDANDASSMSSDDGPGPSVGLCDDLIGDFNDSSVFMGPLSDYPIRVMPSNQVCFDYPIPDGDGPHPAPPTVGMCRPFGASFELRCTKCKTTSEDIASRSSH